MKLRRFLALFLALVPTFPLFGCTETVPDGMVEVYLRSKETIFDGDGNEKYHTLYEYDENGNLLVATKYDDGRKWSGREYFYDSRGTNIGFQSFGENYSTGEIVYSSKVWSQYEYDADGNIIWANTYEGDEQTWSYAYTYDSAGRMCKRLRYEADGITLIGELNFEYDEEGRILRMRFVGHDEDGAQETSEERYEYDTQGNLLRHSNYYNGKESIYKAYTYDKKGNKLSYVWVQAGEELVREEYRYNNGTLKGLTNWTSGKSLGKEYLITTKEYTWNRNGCLTKVTRSNDNGVLEVTAYEYIRLILTPEQAERITQWCSQYYDEHMIKA